MKNLLFYICLLVLGSCNNDGETIESEHSIKNNSKNEVSSEYYVLTIENPVIGWGYQIFKDGKLVIDQKHIPVIQGYRGFSSKENAEKLGNYIIEKMKNGVFPPTLNQSELDSLGVLN